MHSYQYVKFHRRRSMVRASTGPDLGVSRSEERSGSSTGQTAPNPVHNPKILPKRSSSATARVITVRPCSRTTTLLSMANSGAGSIDEDVVKPSTPSYSSPYDRSRSSSVVPPSRTNSSQSMKIQLPDPPTNKKSPGNWLKVLPYMTISSVVEASDEQFLCDHNVRFIINLTGDDSLSYMRNRCKCGKESLYHNGTQPKLTLKIFPNSKPEAIIRQFSEISSFISNARKYANVMVLVFNESGENEVESVPILYMMQYFNSERSRAEAQIIKALSSTPRRDGRQVCTMTAETRRLLDVWWTEVKRRSTQQLAGDVSQLNFNKVKERPPIRAAWP